MPAAVMLAFICPTTPLLCSNAPSPLPVSITTSFEPVLTTIGLNGIVTWPFGM